MSQLQLGTIVCIIYCYSDYRSHFLSNSQLVSFSVCTMSSLRFFATRILVPFYYHDSKLLNSSDRVERQVKSSRYPLQSEFRSSAGSPSLRPNIFIRGHFRSPTIYSGLQFSSKKKGPCIIVEVRSTGPALFM